MEDGDKLYLTEGHKCSECVFNNLCELACSTYDNYVSSTIDGFVPECKMGEGLIYKIAHHLSESPTDRMKIELDELVNRLVKLCKFIQSDSFSTLDTQIQNLLINQRDAMDNYQAALRRRLELMTGCFISYK